MYSLDLARLLLRLGLSGLSLSAMPAEDFFLFWCKLNFRACLGLLVSRFRPALTRLVISCDRAVVGGDLRPATSPPLSPKPMRWSAAERSLDECVRFKDAGGGVGLRGGQDLLRLRYVGLQHSCSKCRACFLCNTYREGFNAASILQEHLLVLLRISVSGMEGRRAAAEQ